MVKQTVINTSEPDKTTGQTPYDSASALKYLKHTPKRNDFSEYLSTKLIDSTRTKWDASNKGRSNIPSSVTLRAARNVFGAPSLKHSFHREPDFYNISIFLLKGTWLDYGSFANVLKASPLIATLWVALVDLVDVPFQNLCKPDLHYKSHKSIPQDRVDWFTACAFFYNFDMPSVIRFVGGNYTASYRDVSTIIQQLKECGNCDDHLLQEIQRVFTVGCPPEFVAESSQTNFLTYLNYGNHSSAEKNSSKLLKAMVKEASRHYIMPFPDWFARFAPNVHLTPQGLLQKPGKNDRPIWDGSF